MTDLSTSCPEVASENEGLITRTNTTASRASPTTSFMQQMRGILDEVEESGDIQGLRIRWLEAVDTLAEEDLSDLHSEACLTASTAVKEVLDQPRNRFIKIEMGDETLLALLSPKDPVNIESVHSGSRGLQYFHVPNSPDLPETVLRIPKSSEEHIPEIAQNELLVNISRFMREGYILERVSRTTFNCITLPPRHLMLILSCSDPITVKDVKGQEGSVLIAGRIPWSGIEAIARVLNVEFDTDQSDGIFQTRLKAEGE